MRLLYLIPLLLILACAGEQKNDHINISNQEQSEVKILYDYSGKPDSTGTIHSYTFELPSFTSGCYYVQDHVWNVWPDGANRVLPFPFQNKLDSQLNRGGLFIYFHLSNGKYLVILPLASQNAISWFDISQDGSLNLKLGNLGTEAISGDIPLVSWSVSDDFYEACQEVWKNAIDNPDLNIQGKLRYQKDYPEVFNYLGWCSWEQFRHDIDESTLVNAAKNLEESKIPVRWLLVDDGYHDVVGEKFLQRKLVSFEPDKEKFPNGWKPLLSLRDPDKIKWMGIWHNNQGYFNGLARENKFGPLNEHLESLPSGVYLPKPNPKSMEVFLDRLFTSVRDYGFDFVKIDDQAGNLYDYRQTKNGVKATMSYASVREELARKYFGSGMINCMAHNTACAFSTRYSSVTRCSIDYLFGDKNSAASHIWQSYNNSLWLGQTVWPDHDMFHSSDPGYGQLMAVSKALSGAPIYLSDAPDDMINEFIMPLCFEDGRLLRPVAPAIPFPESALINPMTDDKGYRVIAPLSNGSAVVVLYNLNEIEDKVIECALNPEDYSYRNGLIQPYQDQEPLPQEGLVLFDWYEQKGRVFEGQYSTKLNGFSDKLLILCPIKEGWSIIGRSDKYLSTEAISDISYNTNNVTFTLKESGPIVVYSENGIPKMDDLSGKQIGNNFYLFNMPVGNKNTSKTIVRGE